jgi:hypothetical protein
VAILPSFIVFVIGIGTLSLLSKERVSQWAIRHSSFSPLVNFLLLASPLIIIEESFTCEIDPFLPFCIAKTYPIFIVLLLVPYALQKFTKISWRTNVVLFGLLGWFAEFILAGRINQAIPVPILILLSLWVIPIYSVISLLPLYYLHKTKE